ncbi:calcineurin-like phosphoesterase [Colletotrichum sojae]|uniref:Calcineurin-like phosphoesterase n=1 Tax=Colletotrichum sojae TaxID=2175907 RepID=A0A8H6MP41_9PEZI|nr:calcineurin-like phosphoesterase [Colletotrichum sojae]
MSIQIVSDLHLEAPKAYDFFEIVPKAPILALLGDVGNVKPHRAECLAFLTRQLRAFRTVLFVPGNHEAYHSNWPEALAILRDFEHDVRRDASLGDFVLLERTIFRVPDTNTVILGCSLFSRVPPQSREDIGFGLNEFFQTIDWDVDAYNESHERDLSWLNAQVADLERTSDVNIAIFSHWSPTMDRRSIDQQRAASKITCGFATDLSGEECFKSSRVRLWAFGHTHFNCDFLVEREDGAAPLRLVTNQRGYYFSQAIGFDVGKVLEF